MATINRRKLEAVINHIQGSGDDAPDVICALIDLGSEDIDTAKLYVRQAKKRISEMGDGAKEDKEGTLPQKVYQLVDEAGLLRDLEVVKVKGERIILRPVYVADTVQVIVRGEEVVVDLNELKKLPADSVKDGIKVSVLIAAAELARL